MVHVCPSTLPGVPILSFLGAAVRFSIMCPVLPLRKHPCQAAHGIEAKKPRLLSWPAASAARKKYSPISEALAHASFCGNFLNPIMNDMMTYYHRTPLTLAKMLPWHSKKEDSYRLKACRAENIAESRKIPGAESFKLSDVE